VNIERKVIMFNFTSFISPELLVLLPLIEQGIKTAEKLKDGKATGEEKEQEAIKFIKNSYKIADDKYNFSNEIDQAIDVMLPVLIKLCVATYNTVGIFQKGAK